MQKHLESLGLCSNEPGLCIFLRVQHLILLRQNRLRPDLCCVASPSADTFFVCRRKQSRIFLCRILTAFLIVKVQFHIRVLWRRSLLCSLVESQKSKVEKNNRCTIDFHCDVESIIFMLEIIAPF